MTTEELESFDACDFPQTFGEIGSRGMQRFLITQLTVRSARGEMSTLNLPMINDWIEVQAGRYRYIGIDYGSEIVIRIVIGEYLACEVMWEM